MAKSRERWTQNYYTMRDHVLASVPYPLRVVVGLLVYRNIAHTLHGQGTGRYTDDEIASFQREIWDCISQVLSAAKAKAAKNTTSDKNDELFWLLAGDEPTEADATLFGFIISTLVCTAYVRLSYPPTCLKIARFFVWWRYWFCLVYTYRGPQSQRLLKEYPVILEYASRIQERYFPDYVKLGWT